MALWLVFNNWDKSLIETAIITNIIWTMVSKIEPLIGTGMCKRVHRVEFGMKSGLRSGFDSAIVIGIAI